MWVLHVHTSVMMQVEVVVSIRDEDMRRQDIRC